jgi:hypothetical protein
MPEAAGRLNGRRISLQHLYDESYGCVQYLADEVLHLSASGKFANAESRRGDHYQLQGVHSGPRRSIQAQRVLVVGPKDTVSGSERPGMVMIDVALRKQPRATARGGF